MHIKTGVSFDQVRKKAQQTTSSSFGRSSSDAEDDDIEPASIFIEPVNIRVKLTFFKVDDSCTRSIIK